MPTLTQSETLKTGQRGPFEITKPKPAARAAALGITAWVEKRRAEITAEDRLLSTFVDLPMGYSLMYGIRFEGRDYECGNMPRDIGGVIRGIAIARGIA